jgi:hypothetical protein
MSSKEPATPKQRALIEYLGHSTEGMSKAEASSWLDQAIASREYDDKLWQWKNEGDCTRLHPELYPIDVRERKHRRAEQLKSMTGNSFDPYTRPVSMSLACKAVEFLDAHLSGWDQKLISSCGLSENEDALLDLVNGPFLEAVEILNPKLVKKSHQLGASNRFAGLKHPGELDVPANPTAQESTLAITITRDGSTYGPFSPSQILDLIKEGRVVSEDLAWREGEVNWRPLHELMPCNGDLATNPPYTKRPERMITFYLKVPTSTGS